MAGAALGSRAGYELRFVPGAERPASREADENDRCSGVDQLGGVPEVDAQTALAGWPVVSADQVRDQLDLHTDACDAV